MEVSHPSVLMEVVTGGSHGHSRKWWSPPTGSCSRWYALHLHPCSRSCGSRAGNLRDPIFDDRFLKTFATREAELAAVPVVTRITALSKNYCFAVIAPGVTGGSYGNSRDFHWCSWSTA